MHSRARTRFLAGVLTIAAAIGVSGCANAEVNELDSGNGQRITIGSQGTLESRIIAQLYGQALADHGYLVDYNDGAGSRDTYLLALQDGSIDLVPDTSGALLYGTDPAATARSQPEIEEALPEALEPLSLHVLEEAPADNAQAFVVTDEFAKANQVASIGELAYFAKKITFGVTADFSDRRYGPAGLLSAYDLTGYRTRVIDDGGGTATVGDLLTDAIQVAVISSTSPAINRNGLRVLSDPKSLITSQNVVPLVNDTANSADVKRLLNPISEALTTAELRKLNEQATASVSSSPENIARKWLAAKGMFVG